MTTIRFDEAWTCAHRLALEVSDSGRDVVVVRDLLGRVSLIVDHLTQQQLETLATRVREQTAAFSAPVPVRNAQELFNKSTIFDSPDLIIDRERTEHQGQVTLLEREIVGADWTRAPDKDPLPNRVTFYGFKGGVGRSTAAFMLAQHLAFMGKCVLVIDLDLESPGLGALTQLDEDLPDHGIVDYFVESAVGNEEGLDLVTRSRVIAEQRNGEVWLAPAAGRPRPDYDYLSKLNRVYTELPASDEHTGGRFGARLERAVRACEQRVTDLSREPDAVILDSRAGIHDVAATALTHLGGLNLLFAADTPQTWSGYRALFNKWRRLPNSRQIGERLQMVSSMTPAAHEASYLAGFADRSQACFSETLYETTLGSDDIDAFNFSVSDPAAPHSPIPILFSNDLVGLDPVRTNDWHQQKFVEEAFRAFLDTTTQLIFGDPQ